MRHKSVNEKQKQSLSKSVSSKQTSTSSFMTSSVLKSFLTVSSAKNIENSHEKTIEKLDLNYVLNCSLLKIKHKDLKSIGINLQNYVNKMMDKIEKPEEN